jgi:formylmethanofuran--tetrahydromethanopterin N-formyltransferase
MEGGFWCRKPSAFRRRLGRQLLILAVDPDAALAAAEAAVDVMRKVRGIILPFPGGMVRAAAGGREAL